MRRVIFWGLLVGLLLNGSAWGSPTSIIKDIQIEKNQEGILVSIFSQGEVCYQIGEMENPPRVIVDFEDAKHDLPHLNYFQLPPCGIKSIRTSQFKLDPKRVRVVLDLEKMIPYKVAEDKENFRLLLPGANEFRFKTWLASQAKPTKKKVVAREKTEGKPIIKKRLKPVKPIVPPEPQTAKLPSFTPRRAVHYSSGGRRDPFESLWGVSELQFGSVPLPNVENLNLVGILEDSTGFRALLEDLSGYGYILRKGDKVKGGYVARVTKEKIVFQVVEYGWTRTVVLKMRREKKSEVGYE